MLRQFVAIHLIHWQDLHLVIQYILEINNFTSDCIPFPLSNLTDADEMLDILLVLILDYIKPIGNLIGEVLL
jgi:hypothetical protein